ncbi:MAG: DUF502 domain-containing protein [Synergistetes bacterium]|nr:DUF502 domain-containing protein [Synergistota bacterium]MCX8127304.1 DUF502 domain-containing protein [Synergistota bacterium]MDW8191809.1 DUF502 domain-containing protein [Synergistota bacterium]
MRKLRHYFFAGLILVVPFSITLYVFYQIFLWIDANLGKIVPKITGYQIPGISFIFLGLLIVLTILIGMLTANYIGKRLVSFFEGLLSMIPLVRGIYMTVKQILEVILVKGESSFREVVLVEFPRKGMYCIGFVTSKRCGKLASKDEDIMIVFIPTTPNPTSGFMVLIPSSEAIPLSISVNQALKLVVSGGVLAKELLGEEGYVWELKGKRELDTVVTSNTSSS